MARREDVPICRVVLGKAAGQAVSIYAFTAAEMGIPLVEMQGALEHMEHLTTAQADQLSAGLALAARVARGEEVLQTPLDQFMKRRTG